jgi:succinate-semialdehyde dehydrogenase / glutarate-semialdehyde dehydrogenase
MSAFPAGMPNQLLINGQWRDSTSGSFDVFDPSTNTVITTVPRAGEDEIAEALESAAAAQIRWAARAPRERGEVLRKSFEMMIERREEIAHLMSLENGKALPDARAEVTYAAEFFRWFSEEAVRIGGENRVAPSGAYSILTNRLPVGVCFLITPWNFPAAMATRKIGPAIAAGCSVILKPAAETPLTALLIGKILMECGLEPGVVNIITTDQPRPATAQILNDDRIRKLSFTGSTQVGRVLLEQAAGKVLRTSMELGGNDPFIVCEDADIDLAVEGAMLAKMRNGGQACTAANLFFVHESVADQFGKRLSDRMGALVVGAGTAEDSQLGPMINAKAVTKIGELVSDAIAKGAIRLLGDEKSVPAQGCFYPATVLDHVPAEADITTEEVFGPVASIVRVSSDEDALRLANATEFGLVGYIFTRDIAKGLRMARALEVGMVGLNRGLVSDPAAPFGGIKQSGLGREGGFEGIEEYLETQYVSVTI